MPRRLFLSVGDLSAANYLWEILREGFDRYELVGITDEGLESLGVRSVAKISQISVVGLAEVLPKLLEIKRVFSRVVEELKECDVLIACDAPGFNLRLIKEARRLGVKRVIYFISPQVWAWKPKRAETIAKYSDHLIVILPFEIGFYRKYEGKDFKVHYVGHPLVDMVSPGVGEEEFRSVLGLSSGRIINLMPGSRWGEIRRHTPLLRGVLSQLLEEHKDLSFVLPTFEEFKEFLSESFDNLPVKILTAKDLERPAYSSMFHSELSLIASGTSSLEAAIAGNPHIVFYRVNPITYILAKLLVKVPYVSLPNLILKREVVPEMINTPPEEIASQVKELLKSDRKRELMREELTGVRELLGGSGSLQRLRELFLELTG